MTSYTSQGLGLCARAQELWHLARASRQGRGANAAIIIERMTDVEARVNARWGRAIRGARILDIGCGQTMSQSLYYSAFNTVDALDYNIIARGFDPVAYTRMWRANGTLRVAKTLGRKALGIDRAYIRELSRRLGRDIPPPRLLQMDAQNMDIPTGTYDFACSFSVFEHLPEPGLALHETARILKPGGAAYISLHLYTSDSGIHDARIFAHDRTMLPLWSHLRPAHAHLVRPNAYLNRLRLDEWRNLFEEAMPGAELHLLQYHRDEQWPLLQKLRAAGELLDYTDDELLTCDLAAVWVKPLQQHRNSAGWKQPVAASARAPTSP